MKTMIENLTVDEIDAAQSRRRLSMTFSSDLESLYRSHDRDENYRYVFVSGIIGIVLYDLFLISDSLVSGSDFYIYVIFRLLVATPLYLTASYCIIKRKGRYQFWISSQTTILSFALSIMLISTHGSYRSSYLFGDILLMMCYCTISRPRIKYAAVTISLQFMSYMTVVYCSDIVASSNVMVSLLFCASGAILSMITCYEHEQASRRTFLMSLRIRLLNQKLEAMAMTDPLTGLGNRRSLENATERFWKTKDPARVASMILVDVDRFKSYNDNYGHPAGDLALKIIGRCVADAKRNEHDVAVRFGGEELLVFLPETDFIEAREIAESIRLAICDQALPHPVIAMDAVVTASFGVAHAPVSECTVVELVARADIALYAAKKNGRNQVWPPPPSTLSSPSQDQGRSLPALPSAA